MSETRDVIIRARTIAEGMPLERESFTCLPGKGESIVVTITRFLKKEPGGAAKFARVALYLGRFQGWYERPNVFIIPPAKKER